MKKYSQEDALNEIFESHHLPPTLTVYKHRYKNGKLSQKTIDEILKEHNFVVHKPTLYIKK